MTRNHWFRLGPSLLVGAGIIAATRIAVLTAASGWLVVAGPLVLALAVGCADMLESRLRGLPSGPSWAARILCGTFLLASPILAYRDPNLVKTMIPAMGAASWVALFLRDQCWGAARRTTG